MTMIMLHPARIVAPWMRAARDAAGFWVRREVALRSDGMLLGRFHYDYENWRAVQPWRASLELLAVVLAPAGYAWVE